MSDKQDDPLLGLLTDIAEGVATLAARIDGIETLKRIKEINSKIQVVLFTGHGSEETRRMGEVLGAFSYVDKIDGLPKLAPMIEGAFRLRKVLEDTYADAAMNEYN